MIKVLFNIDGDGTTVIPSPGAYRLMTFIPHAADAAKG
jgi:hypothetical protein